MVTKQECLDCLRVKSSFMSELFNRELTYPVTAQTWAANVQEVKGLIVGGKVPSRYWSVKVPANNYKTYNFDFACLLWVFAKEKDSLRVDGTIARYRKLTEITEKMIEKWLQTGTILNAIKGAVVGFDDAGNPLYKGKWFSFLFSIEGIKCHQNSFYNWSHLNPKLPTFDRNRLYTATEFEMWREFLMNKPGRQPPQQQQAA